MSSAEGVHCDVHAGEDGYENKYLGRRVGVEMMENERDGHMGDGGREGVLGALQLVLRRELVVLSDEVHAPWMMRWA